MTDITDKAGIGGFFTNHSLRRSGATHLFQAGVDCKLVKEYTGHMADAIDKYQITSDEQCEKLSSVISGEIKHKKGEQSNVEINQNACNLEVSVTNKTPFDKQGCVCMKSNVKMNETEEVGKLIMDILKTKKAKNTIIKLQIEFNE